MIGRRTNSGIHLVWYIIVIIGLCQPRGTKKRKYEKAPEIANQGRRLCGSLENPVADLDR